MDLHKSNRRAFIRDTFAVAATAALLEPGSDLFGRASAAESNLKPIRLGGPSFAKTENPEELALAHRNSATVPPIAPAWRSRTPSESVP